MATNYSRGRAFEYRVRDYLAGEDWRAVYVMRAAGSHTPADLIALWEHKEVWLIQCKRDGRLPAAERKKLLEIADAASQTAVLAKAGPKGRGVVFDFL